MGFPCVRSVSAKKRKEKLFLLPSNVSKLNIKAKRIAKIPYPNESLDEIGEPTEVGQDGEDEDEDEEEEDEDEDHERNFTSVQDSCEMLRLGGIEVILMGRLQVLLGMDSRERSSSFSLEISR